MEHVQNPAQASTDPFGRMTPDDGSQDRFRNMSDVVKLEAAVGPTDENRPDDVAKAEIMLDHMGFLDLRETEGPTGFYGERLRQAITALQRQIGQMEDGRMEPGDPTHIALQQGAKNARHNAPDSNAIPASSVAG